MKRHIFILLLGGSLMLGSSVHAQSLDDLLQSIGNIFSSSDSTEAKSEAPITHPEVYELFGRWYYDNLTLEYKGDNPLMGAAISTLESQLPTIASKFGLTAGSDYMHVEDDGSLTFVQGEKSMSAMCTYYEADSGTAYLQFYIDNKAISLEAIIVEQDGKTRILFDAVKMMALLEKHYSKFSENTSLQMAKTIIDKTSGIYVGVIIKRA